MSAADVVVEAKDGKLALKQKSLKWDETTTTLRELLDFADSIKQMDTQTALKEIPASRLPLIAKLTIESDKTSTVLTKNIKKAILKKCGLDDKNLVDDPRLPIPVISEAVTKIATRVNYGLQDVPVALAVFRWEINDPSTMLPGSEQESICNAAAAVQRQKDREDARERFRASYDALPEEQKKTLLEKQPKKTASKEKDRPVGSPSTSQEPSNDKPTPTKEKKEVKHEKKEPQTTTTQKPKDTKQAALMKSFFKSSAKPKESPSSTPAKPSVSDYDRVFKPFLLKKGLLLAPVNVFQTRMTSTSNSSKGKGKERADSVIVLDDDGDIEMIDAPVPKQPTNQTARVDVSNMNARDLLNSFLSSVTKRPRRRHTGKTPRSSPTKRQSRELVVRNVLHQLNEAEVTDDVKTVRRLESLLKDRRRLPLKYLQFCDNVRPAYYGTWTKSSAFVRFRRPLSKDPVMFDYSYDSGEEWEEEPDDAEEVADSGGEEEEESIEEEDEFDDWLVGDDEIEYEAGGSPSDPTRSATPPTVPSIHSGKRKVELDKERDRESKKRRTVKPLVPYISGTFWEDKIGDCQDHFMKFRIQLLNDTPFPIDPFTFVAEPTPILNVQPVAQPQLMSNGRAPQTVTSDGFVVPALPPHLHPSSQVNLPGLPPSEPTQKKAPPKPKVVKNPFPPVYLPQLCRAIQGSRLTKLGLIERLAGEEFKGIKEVKKNAIEAILGEIAVKEGKVWRVKDEKMLQQIAPSIPSSS